MLELFKTIISNRAWYKSAEKNIARKTKVFMKAKSSERADYSAPWWGLANFEPTCPNPMNKLNVVREFCTLRPKRGRVSNETVFTHEGLKKAVRKLVLSAVGE